MSFLPRGLNNGGNTCYFNALLQALYHLEPIRTFFDSFTVIIGVTNTSIVKLVQNLFIEFRIPGKALYLVEILDFIQKKCPQLRKGFQQDCYEAFNCLKDLLEDELKSSGRFNLSFDNLFKGRMKYSTTCTKCGFKSSVNESFFDITLALNSVNSVKDGFQKHCAGEIMGAEQQFFCNGCSRKGIEFKKEIEIEVAPGILTLTLLFNSKFGN
jgi:ubiquitin carboxyl-terminal hydrolase 22/27/51